MWSKKEKILVAAIDFGTTYSGCAFSFRHDYKKDPTKVIAHTEGNSEGLLVVKQPTCVLCNAKGEFDSFGYDAEKKYQELIEDKAHHNWYFFRRFKMELYEKEIKRGIEIEDDKGMKMTARKVFGMAISYMKTRLLDTLKANVPCLNDDDIHWILTVPGIWGDSAKQFMREAAYEAGIDGNLLSIVLEPEAAALYCRILSSDQLSNNSIFDDKKYILMDIGGGIADFTVHERQADGTIKEVHKASGGPWGGSKVDEEFNQMVIKLIGAPTFKKFCTENKNDYMDLCREIEVKKRIILTDNVGNIIVKVPVSLMETYEKNIKETIGDAIEQSRYRGKIQWTKDTMRLDTDLFKSLFQTCINEINKHLTDLLETPGVKGTSTLLMVGAFSECPFIQDTIKNSFPKVKVVIPKEAGLVVLKGAVIFGHNPQSISSRIARYTYGISISPTFDPKKHPQEKKVRVEGIDRCKDVFRKYIEVGESVKIGEAKISKLITTKYNQPERLLEVYASTEKNPKFITDSSCKMVGRVIVRLPGKNEHIRVDVKMMFGETELMVEAEEEIDKAKFVAFFDLL